LNEFFTDVIIKVKKGTLNDDNLAKLIKEVIDYDGTTD
jgi:hypothetical protein